MDLLIAFFVSVGINIAMFLPAFMLKTDKLTDISYAITFVTVALYSLLSNTITTPSILLMLMIAVWAFRLGSYLLIRIRRTGKDSRFDDKRDSFIKFGGFWLLQGLSVWVIMLSSLLFFAHSQQNFSVLSAIGFIIWASGLRIEAVADKQKFNFINNPKNKGKWIASGLWKYSRHPNYLGEIMVWVGVYIYVFSTLDTTDKLIGFASPAYIMLLLLFVSGVPLLEKSADKRWGDNPKYQAYKQRTSILLLLPNKKT